MENAELYQELARTHFPDARRIGVERLPGGVSAEVKRLDLELNDGGTRRVVVREHGAAHSGHDAALEYELLAALHAEGLAVPRPLALDASRTILPNPCLILEYVEGSAGIPANGAKDRITAMARHLSLLHASPTNRLPLLPSRLDPVPELLEFLPDGAEWSGFRSKLETLGGTAYKGAPVLLHGDFWPQNVIWNDGRIAAVIDWEDAALGDPLSDLACACLELRYNHGDEGAEWFAKAYGEDPRRDPQRVALWEAYVAAAGYRSMGTWGLEPSREAAMRAIALETLNRSKSTLGA